MIEMVLWEVEEEVGVDFEKVEIIGFFSDFYIFVSNFYVFLKVVFVKEVFSFVFQFFEVVNILEVFFYFFQQFNVLMYMDLCVFNGLILFNVLYFKVFDKVVWGVILLMLGEFLVVVGNYK